MFISDGKTLFGNSGLLISIIILLILLYFTYNKCYINDKDNKNNYDNYDKYDKYKNKEYIEKFDLPNIIDPQPTNVRIIIDGSTLTLNFSMSITGLRIPTKFIIVLAQYDNTKKNTGNNKIYLSNEYEMNSSISVDKYNYQTNVCSLVDGKPQCQYKFTNIDIRDSNGNLFYYRIGISAVYESKTNTETENTPFIMPYNIKTIDQLFTLGSSIESQNKIYTDFLNYQAAVSKPTIKSNTSNIYDNTMSTSSGSYEFIKQNLGNYPDNLLIDNQTINKTSLNDLVDKSMSQGIINLNVNINDKLKSK